MIKCSVVADKRKKFDFFCRLGMNDTLDLDTKHGRRKTLQLEV